MCVCTYSYGYTHMLFSFLFCLPKLPPVFPEYEEGWGSRYMSHIFATLNYPDNRIKSLELSKEMPSESWNRHCISYLLLFNKFPLLEQGRLFISSQSVRASDSGVLAGLHSGSRPSRDCSQDAGWGCHHLKVWLGPGVLLPRRLMADQVVLTVGRELLAGDFPSPPCTCLTGQLRVFIACGWLPPECGVLNATVEAPVLFMS